MADIDIGPAPTDRPDNVTNGWTLIQKANPANADGHITSVELWFYSNATGVRVGTFYLVSGNTWRCRDSATIGDVQAGAKRTFTGLNIDVVTGDLIGIYWSTGSIEANASGAGGVWYYYGECIDPEDEQIFSDAPGYEHSVYGTGETVPAPPGGEVKFTIGGHMIFDGVGEHGENLVDGFLTSGDKEMTFEEPPGYGISWDDHETPAEMSEGQQYQVLVKITNTGTLTWYKEGDNPVKLSYHWYTKLGQLVVWDGIRTTLPEDMSPDEQQEFLATVEAPGAPGDYVLKWDMVHEDITWFSQSGCSTLNVDVEIPSLPPPPQPTEGIEFLVTINGVDFSDYLQKESLTIQRAMANQVATASFNLKDPPPFNEWHECILYYSAEGQWFKYWGGYIVKLSPFVIGATRYYAVTATDWTARLMKIRVSREYFNKTTKEIVEDLFDDYLPGWDCDTYVSDSQFVVPYIYFNWCYLHDAIKRLADIDGFVWRIDHLKQMHYGPEGTEESEFDLSSEPDMLTSYPYRSFDYDVDAQRAENRITVRGGYFLSDDAEVELAGNGQSKDVLMPWKAHAAEGQSGIQVWKNTGSDATPNWVALVVGVDFIDSLDDHDVLHNGQEKLLKFALAPPALTRSIRISGRYEIPLITRVQSNALYAKYGTWLDGIIVDPEICDLALAKRTAQTRMAELAQISGKLVCDQAGLEPGQLVRVINTPRAIDDLFLTQSVTLSFKKGMPEYSVQFGSFVPDLAQMVVELRRKQAFIPPRPEEGMIEDIIAVSATQGADSQGILPLSLIDDFEWGADGDPVSDSGGPFTWAQYEPGSCLVEIDDAQAYNGTKSAALYRDGTNWPHLETALTAKSFQYQFKLRTRRESVSGWSFRHGSGSNLVHVGCNSAGLLYYYNNLGVWTSLGVYHTADTWAKVEIRNFNFESGTFDLYFNDSHLGNLTMNPVSDNTNMVRVQVYTQDTVTGWVWYDDFEKQNHSGAYYFDCDHYFDFAVFDGGAS